MSNRVSDVWRPVPDVDAPHPARSVDEFVAIGVIDVYAAPGGEECLFGCRNRNVLPRIHDLFIENVPSVGVEGLGGVCHSPTLKAVTHTLAIDDAATSLEK